MDGFNDGEREADPGLTQLVSAWQALVIDWRLTDEERVALLPGRKGHEEPTGETLARMRVLVAIAHRLRARDGAALREWLRRPDLLFSLSTPLQVMSGPFEDLYQFRFLVERGLGS